MAPSRAGLGTDGYILASNASAERILKLSAEEILGAPLSTRAGMRSTRTAPRSPVKRTP